MFPFTLMVLLYAGLFGLAVLWSWLRGDPAILTFESQASMQTWVAALIGTGAGLFVVATSRLAIEAFEWARRLEREFAKLLGPISDPEVFALAAVSSIAEEAFFRGAMQPTLGLVATSLIFGLLHVGPIRTFWPWTAMALAMGFALGALALVTGGLLAPVLCHATIHLLNLRSIALKARRPEPDRP